MTGTQGFNEVARLGFAVADAMYDPLSCKGIEPYEFRINHIKDESLLLTTLQIRHQLSKMDSWAEHWMTYTGQERKYTRHSIPTLTLITDRVLSKCQDLFSKYPIAIIQKWICGWPAVI